MADDGRIALVGAGPVGTLVAAALCSNQVPFTWVVRNPRRRTQLDELTLQLPEASSTFSLERCDIVPGLDLLPVTPRPIVAVKAQDVGGVLTALPAGTPGPLVISNGMLPGGTAIGLLFGGGFLQSGVLVTNLENRLVLGAPGAPPSDLVWATEAMACGFLAVSVSDRIVDLMWHKLALNCVVNPLTALLDCDNGDLLGRLHGPLVRGILAETLAVMDQVLEPGRDVPTLAELLLSLKQLLRTTRYNSSSMREDLRQGRRTEIAHLNGAVAAAGKRHGIPCPVNEAVVDMISLLSRAE